MTRVRAVILHPRMSAMAGGERVAAHIIKSLVKSGYEVSLVSERFDTTQFERFFGYEHLFDDVQKLAYREFEPFLPRAMLYQRAVYQRARQNQILSHVASIELLVSTQDVIGLPKIASSTPTIQYCDFPENFLQIEKPHTALRRLYYLPARRLCEKNMREMSVLLSNSEHTRRVIRRLWGRDSTAIYPPCPVSSYAPAKTKENMVVSIGRIHPEKRHELFLEMARRLTNLKFVIIGGLSKENYGYYRQLLAKRPANAEIIVSSPLERLRDTVAHSKAYVHCAKNERFGIAIVEAMAAGCVPIVHDSGGPREIVTQGTGFRWNELEDALNKISLVSDDDEMRIEMAKAARVRAQDFRPEVFEDSFSRLTQRYQTQR